MSVIPVAPFRVMFWPRRKERIVVIPAPESRMTVAVDTAMYFKPWYQVITYPKSRIDVIIVQPI